MPSLPSTLRVLVSGFIWLPGAFLICSQMPAAELWAQTDSGQASGVILQQHYNQAQRLQQQGHLNEAAGEYRAFLGDILGELGMGYGLAKDYADAAPAFDEALVFEPDSPSLLLNYARTALLLGDPDHASTLAARFIHDFPADHVMLAQAHQVLGRALLKLNRDREARTEFEAAVALDPTFPNGYDLAVACLDLDDEKCAVQVFGELEKSFGDTPELHMAFGQAYGDSDSQPLAITEFRRAIQENPSLPGAHYWLAVVLMATGADESHVAAAEAELRKELVVSPHDARTYTALGKIEESRNNYTAAEAWLKKAAQFDPQNPDTYLYLGQMYFDTHRYVEAEKALRECIRLTTDVSRNRYQVQKAHFLLGRILMQKGQTDAAHEEMQIARTLANQTLSMDRDKLAALMDTADVHGAPGAAADSAGSAGEKVNTTDQIALRRVKTLRDQVKLDIADSYNNLGAITATNDDYASAVSLFDRAAEWDPSLPGLDYNWGRAAFAASRFADAVGPLARYVKAHPDDSGARSVLALSQFMTGSYQDCLATLEPVTGKVSLAPQVEYAYAESMVMTGQVGPGAERLAALEKAHPEIPDVHRALGEALDRQGQRHRAMDELRTAVQLNPRDPQAHYDLGKLDLENGETAAAVSELEAAVKLQPDSEKFHEELAAAYQAARRPEDAQREIETSNGLRARAPGANPPHSPAAPEP